MTGSYLEFETNFKTNETSMRKSFSHIMMIIKPKMRTLLFLSLPFGGGLEGA
jgi:hypothetical protein